MPRITEYQEANIFSVTDICDCCHKVDDYDVEASDVELRVYLYGGDNRRYLCKGCLAQYNLPQSASIPSLLDSIEAL